ncbi:uncharacterized protein LOC141535013 [Cotesia typhae]|uniref:uncharacterized protein LOC141535013 n=1 Tax=Cotesia typhae TaxID=2053667 RepID=UPI003D69BC8D
MNVIIQTGFEAIFLDILFQPQTIPKGKQFVMAGHVRDVQEFRQCGNSYLIKSKVIRQTSVTLSPYDTMLHINEERFVTDVNCTCVYNKSKKCKHIAALIYYINHEESLRKTSHEQKWGKPSARQFVKQK